MLGLIRRRQLKLARDVRGLINASREARHKLGDDGMTYLYASDALVTARVYVGRGSKHYRRLQHETERWCTAKSGRAKDAARV